MLQAVTADTGLELKVLDLLLEQLRQLLLCFRCLDLFLELLIELLGKQLLFFRFMPLFHQISIPLSCVILDVPERVKQGIHFLRYQSEVLLNFLLPNLIDLLSLRICVLFFLHRVALDSNLEHPHLPNQPTQLVEHVIISLHILPSQLLALLARYHLLPHVAHLL